MMKGNEFKAFKDYLKDHMQSQQDPVKIVGEELFEQWKELPKAVQMRYLEKYNDQEEQKDENDDNYDQTQNKMAKRKNAKGGRGRKSQQTKKEMKEKEQHNTRSNTRKQHEEDQELEDELDFKKMKITSRDSMASKSNSRISQFGTLVIKKAYRLETYIKYYREKFEDKQNSD